MGETAGESRPNSFHVALAIDYYEEYRIARGLGEKSPEATEAYLKYKTHRDSLSSEEQSLIDDRILALERPELAEEPTPAPKVEPITSDHPDIKRLSEMLDEMKESKGGEDE